MMRVIGLAGQAGSGKSTVARILCDRHGFVELSFAQPLRNFCRWMTGMTEAELQAAKNAPHPALCGCSPRRFMQLLGTEFGRDMIGNDLWIRQVDATLAEYGDDDSSVVISDCRFANEAHWIRAQGALVHLSRPGHAVIPHISESGVHFEDGDLRLDNDCDIPTLQIRIAELLKTVRAI